MKKAFDQTVRDLKREVNKKVLKVPGIEQKVLDSTNNEPWGPHGSLLADIALATRNYHEYQMIMAVIWKRINDTGKNWRHVYKALTVLDYLVAHGSERVIDEIREHVYQISTLSDFQYIDSSGRDQGSNVRKKSQSLVVLVNDKERIIEVRQKAAANRDKFRNASSSGGMYRPGSYSSTGGTGDRFDDDRYEGRYGSKDDDRYSRNGDSYGREREWGYRDDDKYGRNGDSYSRDGDRYGREYEDRYGRDGDRDDDYRGRSQSVDGNQYGQRSRSSDRDRERSFDDDGQYSSRSGARGDDSQDGRRLDRKFSEQNIGAPPSYEEASESRSPVHSERDGETPAAAAPRASSPAANNHPISSPQPGSTQNHPSQPPNVHDTSVSPANQEVQATDEFDPRGAVSATPAHVNSAEVDLLGSLSLAIVPTVSTSATSEAESQAPTFAAAPVSSNVTNQHFEDPFGDAPFKAIPLDTTQALPQTSTSIHTTHAGVPNANAGSDFGFGDSLSGLTYSAPSFSSVQTPPMNSEFLPQELSTAHQNTDILADILPPSGPSPAITAQPPFSAPAAPPAQPGANDFRNYQPQPGSIVAVPSNMVPQTQSGPAGQHGNYLSHAPTAPLTSHVVPQTPTGPTVQFNSGNFLPQGQFAAPNNGSFYPQQGASTVPVTSHTVPHSAVGPAGQLNTGNFLPQQSSAHQVVSYQASSGPALQQGNDLLGGLLPQTGQNPPSVAQQVTLPSSTVTLMSTKPADDKFETKSTVWADTLSRGLVNLNISGSKINPLADIGIDFDAINRKEKRMEKPAATPVTSTVTMGRAMGSGSGMGRAGASVLRPPPNAMMGSGMGMGMGMGGVPGVGLYGGMNQQPMGMGMGMNMGMGQVPQMQPPTGFPPGSKIPGTYNPMMGTGGYGPQQPYGGYR
ncbi:clathrin interactor EPSIN 2 isoform X1 [Morus notabilis]|uniref:clathrin interactor EPSIN 2 isoform X1 n=1 Tax=Morus notabilis TaxID=981085 RepID=UPI000CED15CB|nr:clathrin interactor EPSIN 2 isoform X1 [Morus notabilis]